MGNAIVNELLETIGQFRYNKRYNKITDEVLDTIDPTEGPVDDKTITVRTLGITFESIYKNIASYPYNIDQSDPNYLKKKFYLEDDKVISIDIDIRVEGKIVTTITGDTGTKYTSLVKTTTFNNSEINSVYALNEG